MITNEEYTLLSNSEFAIESAKYSDVVHGSGRRIAELAKVNYRTYTNARAGRLKNPAQLGSIIRAMKIVYNERISQYAD